MRQEIPLISTTELATMLNIRRQLLLEWARRAECELLTISGFHFLYRNQAYTLRRAHAEQRSVYPQPQGCVADWLTVHQVSERLAYNRITINRFITKKILPATRVGQLWFVHVDDLYAFEEANCGR